MGTCVTEPTPPMALGIRGFWSRRGHRTHVPSGRRWTVTVRRGAADHRGVQGWLLQQRVPWGKIGGQPPWERLSLYHSGESGAVTKRSRGVAPMEIHIPLPSFHIWFSFIPRTCWMKKRPAPQEEGDHHTTISFSSLSAEVPSASHSANSATGEE